MWYETRYIVRFADVDHAGVMFFAKILEVCHIAMEDLHRDIGIPLQSFFEERDVGFPLVDVKARFMRPHRHGDVMRIEVGYEKLGPRALISRYRIFDESGALCSETRLAQACIDMGRFESRVLPEDVSASLAPYVVDVDPWPS